MLPAAVYYLFWFNHHWSISETATGRACHSHLQVAGESGPTPEELSILAALRAGLHLRTGFRRDRKLVQLFDYPQGWQEGTVMRRCVRNGKPSNVYDIEYADGFTMTQECDPDEYGTTNGKKWCIIQPIERAAEGSESDVD